MQTALQTFEIYTTRFSLQLEADHLKRDLERVKDERFDELSHVQKETRTALGIVGRDLMLDKLHGENLEFSGQLVTQTQARLNLSEMMDATMGNGP